MARPPVHDVEDILAEVVIDTIDTIPAHGLGVDLPDIANTTVALQVTVDPVVIPRDVDIIKHMTLAVVLLHPVDRTVNTHTGHSPNTLMGFLSVVAVPCHPVLHTARTLAAPALSVLTVMIVVSADPHPPDQSTVLTLAARTVTILVAVGPRHFDELIPLTRVRRMVAVVVRQDALIAVIPLISLKRVAVEVVAHQGVLTGTTDREVLHCLIGLGVHGAYLLDFLLVFLPQW